LSRGKGSGLCIAAAVGLVIGLVLLGYLPLSGPPEPANRPWINPPSGENDYIYYNDTILEGGGNDPFRVEISTAIVCFATYEKPVLLYGSFNSPDGDIDFLIVNDGGHDAILRGQSPSEEDIAQRFTSSGGPWEFILQPYLNGELTEKWYVVYSAYALKAWTILPPWEPEYRAVSAQTCQDFTAPTIAYSIPQEVNETVTIQTYVNELRGDIAVIHAVVDGLSIQEWHPENGSCSPVVVWNTMMYENGEHEFGIYVEDLVGNSHYDSRIITINNAYPPIEVPEEIATVINIGSVISFIVGILTVLFTRYERKNLILFALLILASGLSITYINPGPPIDLISYSLSVFGIVLSSYGVWTGRSQAIANERRFERVFKGQKRIEERISEEARKGRRHTTDKTREVRKSIDKETDE
jgi:hypothetical protein